MEYFGPVKFDWKDNIVVSAFLLGNIFYSIIKKSLSISIPVMKKTLQTTNIDIGNMSSQFSIAYGVFKLVGGVLSDIIPAYSLFILGLFLGSVVNLAMLFVVDIKAIIFLWMLNGMAQGAGGPALSKLVVVHFPASVSGSIWSYLTFVSSCFYSDCYW